MFCGVPNGYRVSSRQLETKRILDLEPLREKKQRCRVNWQESAAPRYAPVCDFFNSRKNSGPLHFTLKNAGFSHPLPFSMTIVALLGPLAVSSGLVFSCLVLNAFYTQPVRWLFVQYPWGFNFMQL